MIRFSDLTINESHGNFAKVCEIMREEEGLFRWMLRSDATIVGEDGFTANYLLHLWNDGKVYVHDTNRPVLMGTPDSDIYELKKWCETNGWRTPIIDNRLTNDPRGFDFWLTKYRAGLIDSDDLRRFDEEEMSRMSQALEHEDDEEEEFYIS